MRPTQPILCPCQVPPCVGARSDTPVSPRWIACGEPTCSRRFLRGVGDDVGNRLAAHVKRRVPVHQGSENAGLRRLRMSKPFSEVCVFYQQVGFGVYLRQQTTRATAVTTLTATSLRCVSTRFLGSLSPDLWCAANQRRLSHVAVVSVNAFLASIKAGTSCSLRVPLTMEL